MLCSCSYCTNGKWECNMCRQEQPGLVRIPTNAGRFDSRRYPLCDACIEKAIENAKFRKAKLIHKGDEW